MNVRPTLIACTLILAPQLAACAPGTANPRAASPAILALASPQQDFWQQLQSLCGRAFPGRLTESNAGDSLFARSTVVMHVRECTPGEVRVPLHVGDDRSRSWVITPVNGGLRLKRREGTDRRFRVEFDLTRPVAPPPPPWGSR